MAKTSKLSFALFFDSHSILIKLLTIIISSLKDNNDFELVVAFWFHSHMVSQILQTLLWLSFSHCVGHAGRVSKLTEYHGKTSMQLYSLLLACTCAVVVCKYSKFVYFHSRHLFTCSTNMETKGPDVTHS